MKVQVDLSDLKAVIDKLLEDYKLNQEMTKTKKKVKPKTPTSCVRTKLVNKENKSQPKQ